MNAVEAALSGREERSSDMNRSDLAEAALRAALAKDAGSVQARVGLSELLRQSGRAEAAVALTASWVGAGGPVDHRLLVAHAEGLKALNRMDEALAVYRCALAQHGRSSVAAHNLAAQLGDMARFEEAQILARQALANGSDAPQTWSVLARALQGCNRLEESQQAYVEVLRRAPFDADAHRELAQLVWMREADMGAALATLDRAISARNDPRLIEVRAMARKSCGDLAGAYEEVRLAARDHPRDPVIQMTAAQLATAAGFAELGVDHARAAVNAAPGRTAPLIALCEACLGVGDAARAAAIATERLAGAAPQNQSLLAYLATAWRLMSDGRYDQLHDYATMVSASRLDCPAEWLDLESYLLDLAQALDRAHVFQAHPFGQSLVGGAQISNLTSSAEPAVRAVFQALAGPIQRRLQQLGTGLDPFRSRNTGSARFQGVWSVRLATDHGRRVDHVHPKGWMSSACYVSLPDAVSNSADRQGWLQFGRPGVRTEPMLPADHFVRPEPGMLVLFPSYMWHGTLPFSGQGARLTVAFDLVPR